MGVPPGRVPDRLVEISVTGLSGKELGYGSGWVVDEDLILTAAHVLRTHEPGELTVEVRQGMWAAYHPWHRCEIHWADPELDAALLIVTGAGWTPPPMESRPRLGLSDPDITECQIFGFPRFTYGEEYAHNSFQGGGRLKPANLGRGGLMAVDLDPDDCPGSAIEWSGISGAAVLTARRRSLVGIVIESELGNARRLRVLPADRLTQDAGFTRGSRAYADGLSEARNRRRILSAVLRLLERSEHLRHPRIRRDLAARLAAESTVRCDGDFLLPTLVDHCARQPAGLGALAAAHAQLLPQDHATTAQLLFRADEFESVRLVGAEGWAPLHDVLTRLYDSDLNGVPVSALYTRAGAPGAAEMPTHCDKLWKAFVNLVGTNAPSRGLPAGLHFLELVASAVGGTAADHIHSLNRAWALRMESTRIRPSAGTAGPEDSYPAQVDALRSSLVSRRVRPAAAAKLLVELDPDPASEDRWAVTFYCLPVPGDWRPLPLSHAERRISTRELPSCVETAKQRLIADTGVARGKIEVEYVLPLSLISHPDTLIALGGLSYTGLLFPIVVHSRDRLRHSLWRETWQERWRPLSGRPEAGELVHSGGELRVLREEIRGNDRIAGLVLSRKPSPDGGLDEVSEALENGVPLVMWRHHDDAQPDFGKLFTRIMAEGSLDQPGSGRDDVSSLGPDSPDGELHRHVVMIFDVPDRLPGLIYGGAW